MLVFLRLRNNCHYVIYMWDLIYSKSRRQDSTPLIALYMKDPATHLLDYFVVAQTVITDLFASADLCIGLGNLVDQE